MANISLATLRDYWQNVSDWVRGVDAVSAPKVTLSASSILDTQPVPVKSTAAKTLMIDSGAVGIPGGGTWLSSEIDVTGYSKCAIQVSGDGGSVPIIEVLGLVVANQSGTDVYAPIYDANGVQQAKSAMNKVLISDISGVKKIKIKITNNVGFFIAAHGGVQVTA